jgi:hypothetical protein
LVCCVVEGVSLVVGVVWVARGGESGCGRL